MIVADATPLIALAKIKALHILSGLFQEVSVPEAVWTEVVVHGQGKPGAVEISAAPWIHKRQVQAALTPPPSFLSTNAGEREAVALALELNAAALLVDERLASRWAEELGIICLGTLEVLLRAVRHNLISDAQPLIEALQKCGFYMAPSVLSQALEQARALRSTKLSQ